MEAYVQPKYDGSNITCHAGACLTRNHSPLPPEFTQGLRKALGEDYKTLMKLSNRYQVFLELGGTKNSPAGYADGWDGEWDYRVFDLFAGTFLQPPRVEEILDDYGLKYVGHTTMTVAEVADNWKRLLSEDYSHVEGFVLKVFVPKHIAEKLAPKARHAKYGVILVKFKHEYAGAPRPKAKKKHEKRVEKPRGEPLPDSEIMGAINKAHLQLGDGIHDRKKAMPLIFKIVKEEAEKHGNTVPPASYLFKKYQEYLEKIK